jgi:hypothetical protein
VATGLHGVPAARAEVAGLTVDPIEIEFKIWISSNSFENEAIQKMLSHALKIQNKYVFIGIGIRNNFPSWSFSKFGMEIGIKN